MDYHDEDWGNSDYRRCRSEIQVNFNENGNNLPSTELEFGDIEGWNTDIDAGCHLPNHIAANGYRVSGRAGYCDVSKTFAETISARKPKGE